MYLIICTSIIAHKKNTFNMFCNKKNETVDNFFILYSLFRANSRQSKPFMIHFLHMKISVMVKSIDACANETRLEILKLIKHKKYSSVGSVAKGVNLSIKSTSKHLLILHQAHIVKREREGAMIYYSLNRPLNEITKNIIGLL